MHHPVMIWETPKHQVASLNIFFCLTKNWNIIVFNLPEGSTNTNNLIKLIERLQLQ